MSEPYSLTDERTARFYRDHAFSYCRATHAIDMSPCYARFERHLAAGSRILDVGAGSGRDMRHFSSAGFCVAGIDASHAMAHEASQYSGVNVTVEQLENFETHDPFDAIWANAVLLHLAPEPLVGALRQLASALKHQGIMFVSFRNGAEQFRLTDGRLYFGMDVDKLILCIADLPLRLIDSWEDGDRSSTGAGNTWLYAILQSSNSELR